MPALPHTLHLNGVPPNVTYTQLEVLIVAQSLGNKYNKLFFDEDDNSYKNFRDSLFINEGDQVASKATAFMSTSQDRMLIINAFPSLTQQYKATPFPKE